MKAFKMLLVVSIALLVASSIAVAGDFDWLKDLNITGRPVRIQGKTFNPFSNW